MKPLQSTFLLALIAASFPGNSRAEQSPVYLDPKAPVENRVEDLLGRMTLEEKISLVHADSKFTTAAIPRLQIPRRWLSDGPHGVREDIGPDTWKPAGRTDDFASYLPAGIALAATWNPDTGRAYGEVVGQEARRRGKDIMLGPAINIMRTPLCGRNHEYYGEDPYLASRMVVGYIQGEQSAGVASCVKHFAANNQELQRNTIDVEMDERSLREIYLPAFRAAVQEAGVLAVMGAYNKFRGEFCCHNDYLLNRVLKKEWGFKGLVMSDWNGVHETAQAVRNGLDLEMGTVFKDRENKEKEVNYDDFFLARAFREGIQHGDYPTALLDDKVRRNLRVMITTGVLDPKRPEGSLNTPAHEATALRVAEESMVLLKNDGNFLPLNSGKIKSLAVIGENAQLRHASGGDSAAIKALYEITPLEAITRRAGRAMNITFSRAYRQPKLLSEDVADEAGVVRGGMENVSAQEVADMADRAVRAAKEADAVIYVGGLNHNHGFDSEGADRANMKLPYNQDELLSRILEANPRTVVVLNTGSPVEMGPWLEKAPAVVEAWYPGMEGGNALAHLLFGDANPSGKLPFTFPKALKDSPAHALNAYPGSNGTVRYEEGLLVGYRWFDTKKIEPLFPFGHGLSYTTFEYSNLRLVSSKESAGPVVTAEFEVANTGTREGSEVAQLYIHPENPGLPRPDKELKGFKKIALKPGEKKTVSLPLGQEAFSYYDPAKNGWWFDKSDYKVLVGASSRDIRLESQLNLAK